MLALHQVGHSASHAYPNRNTLQHEVVNEVVNEVGRSDSLYKTKQCNAIAILYPKIFLPHQKKKKSILPGYKISRQKKKYETLYTPNGTNLDAYSNVMICAPTYYVHLKRFQS